MGLHKQVPKTKHHLIKVLDGIPFFDIFDPEEKKNSPLPIIMSSIAIREVLSLNREIWIFPHTSFSRERLF